MNTVTMKERDKECIKGFCMEQLERIEKARGKIDDSILEDLKTGYELLARWCEFGSAYDLRTAFWFIENGENNLRKITGLNE